MMKNLRELLGQLVLFFAAALLLSIAVTAHPGSGIVTDRLGQVYFLDTGSGLWRIDARGALSHLSPLRNHWLAIDENNGFTQARLPVDSGGDWVITAAGSSPTMLISTDFPLVIGQDGSLYYPSVRESNVRILRKSPAGAVAEFARLPRSVAGLAIGWINGICTGPDRSIYYTEDNAIRRISSDGRVTTVITIPALRDGPSIPGNNKHPYLRGLKVDADGIVYVADSGDARVLKITPNGNIATLIQLESPWAPTDVAVFGDIVYAVEFSHDAGDDRTTWMPRVRKIGPDGRSTVIVTVDQMPGARQMKAAPQSEVRNISSMEFLELVVRTILLLT